MSIEQNPQDKTDKLPTWPTDETVVTPEPRHQDDFQEKFEGIVTQGDKKKQSRFSKKQRIVAGAALAVVVGGGAFLGKTTGGGNDTNTEPRTEPSIGAPAQPGSNEVLTQAQTERSELQPAIANEAMLSPDYYDTPEGQLDPSNVDPLLLENNLNKLLGNIVYMQETGEFSFMEKTFLADNEGNYPGAEGNVEGVIYNYETNAKNQETNPNQPISSMQVESIRSIEPAGFQTFDVTAEISSIIWGNPTLDQVGIAFSDVDMIRFTLQAQQTQVEGSDATENIWVILHEEPVS